MQTIKRSHTTRSSRLTAMMGCLLVALAFAAQAEAPPQTMSYSGRITGQGGNQINDPLAITFRIYDVAQDGTALWSETHPAVTLTNGQFSVELGSITPINLDFSAKYYLGIQVGSDSEMTPRRPLSSVGYAFHALKAQNSDHAQKSDHAQNSDHATGSDKANSVSDHAIRKESFALECTEGQVYRRTAAGWACETAVGPKGDKGDKGDNGDQGQQGEQGQQGFKGDKGDTGPQGPAGLTQVVTAGFAGSTGTTTQWYANTRLA